MKNFVWFSAGLIAAYLLINKSNTKKQGIPPVKKQLPAAKPTVNGIFTPYSISY